MNPQEHPKESPIDSVFGFCPKLNPEDLEAARERAANPAYTSDKASRTQAENMASSAQIELKPDEISLYCALREQVSPAMGGRVMQEGEQGTRPWLVNGGDHGLLAVVLQLADDQARLQKFMAFFPKIFKAKKKE